MKRFHDLQKVTCNTGVQLSVTYVGSQLSLIHSISVVKGAGNNQLKRPYSGSDYCR